MDLKRLSKSAKYSGKALLIFLLTSLCFSAAKAQAPGAFSYQAQARNVQGALLSNRNIALRASIVRDSLDGPEDYSEVHQALTDEQAFFTLELGKGTPAAGDFSAIDWSAGRKWLKIEMDGNGGTNFTLVGGSQLLSVPYALYANSSGTSGEAAGSMYNGSITDITQSKAFDNKLKKGIKLGSGGFKAVNLMADSVGNLYVSGSIDRTVTIGAYTLAFPEYNKFIARFTPEGKVVWAKGFKMEQHSQVLLGGTLYITGYIYADGNFDKTFFLLSKTNQIDKLILSVDPAAGELMWSRKFDNGGSRLGGIYNISSNLYFINHSRHTILARLDPVSGKDIWTLKTDSTYTGTVNSSSIILKGTQTFLCAGFNGTQKIAGNIISTNRFDGESFLIEFNPAGWASKPFLLPLANLSCLFIDSSIYSVGTNSTEFYINITNFTTGVSKTITGINGVYLKRGPQNSYLYTELLEKIDLNGNIISAKKLETESPSRFPPQNVYPLQDGLCYLVNLYLGSYNLSLGNYIYNLGSNDYILIKYDTKAETILEQRVFKHVNCSFSEPVQTPKGQFIIAGQGQIKVNGEVLSDLVLLEF